MKTIFSILWRLAALAATVSLCFYAIRWCTGYYNPAPLVGLVAPDGQLSYVDADAFAEHLQSQGYRFVKAGSTLDTAAGADLLIAMDPQVIIICCDAPFTDEAVVEHAREKDITLLFVGAEPRQALLDGYDKAWALCNDAAHGGQLLGREAALAFREGRIADVDEDILLDCVAVLPQTYPSAGVIGREVIAEAEHYGVYSDLFEVIGCPASDLPIVLDALWHGEDWQPPHTEPADEEAENDNDEDEDETTYPCADIPELVTCAGAEAARAVHAKAVEMGWPTTRFAVLAESESEAAALAESGAADYIAYYDRETATRILTVFTDNVLNRRFVAQDCEVQPDPEKQFIFAYKLWE